MITADLHPDNFQIHLPLFEGPFDLLLFFIERDEIDIYDIPIAKITTEFLEYIQLMQVLNIEVAAEFILVAGTLMRIKSRMLLPRPELDAKGDEIDPREELVARLLEYKKYKSVVEELSDFETAQSERIIRGNIAAELKIIVKKETPIEDLEQLDPYTLLKVFKKVWERYEHDAKTPKHVIQQYPYKMDDVRESIKVLVFRTERIDFVEFIMQYPNRIYVVFSFLAILELAQEKVIRISTGTDYNQFWIMKREEEA